MNVKFNRSELTKVVQLLNPSLRIFTSDCLPPTEEDSVIVQVPLSSSERERLLAFPDVSPFPEGGKASFGDVVILPDRVALIIPDYVVAKPQYYLSPDPCYGIWWEVYRWNRHRYRGACIRCGADGPIDFYCEVCGA